MLGIGYRPNPSLADNFVYIPMLLLNFAIAYAAATFIKEKSLKIIIPSIVFFILPIIFHFIMFQVIFAEDTSDQAMFSTAVLNQDMDKMKYYVSEKHVDINTKWFGGRDTPLHQAVLSGGYDGTVAFLIDNGADVNAKGQHGWTPLIMACHPNSPKANLELLKLLISKGADVNATDDAGHTALMECICKGGVEAVEFLIKSGADINAKAKNGDTIFSDWRAPYCNNKDRYPMLNLLIKNGADPSPIL